MDFNGDGYRDLVFGSQEPEQLIFYAGDKDCELTKVGPIKTSNGNIITGDAIIEGVVVDWNNDGLLDLVVGQRGGYNRPEIIRLYINSGTKENYEYKGSTNILLRNKEKLIGYHHFDVVDMDKDTKKDFIICGRRNHLGDPEWCGSVFLNNNTDSDPKFENDMLLTSEGKTILGNWGPLMDVADWNNDGAWDLLLGEVDGFENGIRIYLGKPQTGIEPSKNVVKSKAGAFSCRFSPDRCYLTVSCKLAGPENKLSVKLYGIDGKTFYSVSGISEPGATIRLPDIRCRVVFIAGETENGFKTGRVAVW